MADRTHLDILVRGVAAWNDWRAQEQDTRPDLSRLTMDDLMELAVGGDDPFDVWLSDIDLTDVSLVGATLDDVNLDRGSLQRADLTEAKLSGVSLRNGDLRAVRLVKADLRSVNLAGVDLAGTHVGDTLFIRMDLSEVEGLQYVYHEFESIIDTATLDMTLSGLAKTSDRRLERVLSCQAFFTKCGVPPRYLAPFDVILD